MLNERRGKKIKDIDQLFLNILYFFVGKCYNFSIQICQLKDKVRISTRYKPAGHE